MNSQAPADTIVAIATAPGRGAIGVLRVSGPLCRQIARSMLGELPSPRMARYREFRAQDEILDQGVALFFSAPHSATGEDVLELHAHGNPLLMDALQEEICRLGARLATAGEFSERAFRNGKIDLAQAEAVADLIASDSRRAARGALRSLQGAFSKRIEELKSGIMKLRVELEAGLDFPEEDIDPENSSELAARIETLVERLETLLSEAGRGRRLQENLQLVMLGAPNSGKSTLLNALAGQEAAIVSDTPGTTRDALSETLALDGFGLVLADTAGLHSSDDAIEVEGMRRALELAKRADHLLLVCTGEQQRRRLLERLSADEALDKIPRSVIRSKCDLDKKASKAKAGEWHVSALTGAGMEELKRHLTALAGGGEQSERAEGAFSARRRHLEGLRECLASAERARALLLDHGVAQAPAELLAEELRLCQEALGSIVGEHGTEELLGEIFSSFCIGK